MNIKHAIDCQRVAATLYRAARINMDVDPQRSIKYQKAAAQESLYARRAMGIE